MSQATYCWAISEVKRFHCTSKRTLKNYALLKKKNISALSLKPSQCTLKNFYFKVLQIDIVDIKALWKILFRIWSKNIDAFIYNKWFFFSHKLVWQFTQKEQIGIFQIWHKLHPLFCVCSFTFICYIEVCQKR